MKYICFILYFAVFVSQPVKRQNPAICFCYFNTEGRLHLWNLLVINVETIGKCRNVKKINLEKNIQVLPMSFFYILQNQ